MKKERWKPVKGEELRYEVSDLGRIRSFKRVVRAGWSSRIIQPRILKPVNNGKGYLTVVLSNKKQRYIHRIVAETFLKKHSKNTQVNHKDGIKNNNKLSNLEWVSNSENLKHSYKIGTHTPMNQKGENNPRARLNKIEVLKIKRLRMRNVSVKKIAKIYNVTIYHVYNITNGHSWKNN